ncbi:hypothetical protein F2Q69_00036528 [Brassica cretica]|uniref:Uncharacterized protein n=1 Tax=Brassica cretica TaxID=69181 RepID=A0A8S9SP67_BRACR|nr:hypothetical protein F2Q69_00036528 [Brassica cretica]
MEEEAEGLTEEANRGGGGGGLGEVSSRECPLLVLRFRHGFSSGGFSPFARSLSSPVHSPASSREVRGVFISALVFALGSPPMCWPELREYWIRFSDPDGKLRVMKTMYSEFATSASHFGLEGVDVLVASAIDATLAGRQLGRQRSPRLGKAPVTRVTPSLFHFPGMCLLRLRTVNDSVEIDTN